MSISRTSPLEVFRTAKKALKSKDMYSVFACMDAADVNAISKENILAFLTFATANDSDLDEGLKSLLNKYKFPITELIELYFQKLSYEKLNKLLNTNIRKINKDDKSFAYELSDYTNTVLGGYGVSTKLFDGENLENIVEKNGVAWADLIEEGYDIKKPIKFIKTKDGWTFKFNVSKRPIE